MAPTIAFLTAARHSGDRPCRPDPAGGERARRLWRARPRRGRGGQDHRRRQRGRRGGRLLHGRRGRGRGDRRPRSRGAVACPAIGIGASAACDGQVLVTEDMLGLFERTPRFVKRYDDLAARDRRGGRRLCRGRASRAASPPRTRSTGRKSKSGSPRVAGLAFARAAARRCAASFRSSAVGKGATGMMDSPIEWTEDVFGASPNDETFLREVDEELRRDQMHRLRQAIWLLADRRASSCSWPRSAAAIWWRQHQVERSAAAGRSLPRPSTSIDAGKRRRSAPRARRAVEERQSGLSRRRLVRPRRDRAPAERHQAATATLREIADDSELDQALSRGRLDPPDRARVRQPAAAAGGARLQPLARPASPGSGPPARCSALALIKQGKKHGGRPGLRRHRQGQERAGFDPRPGRARWPAALGVDAEPALRRQAQ